MDNSKKIKELQEQIFKLEKEQALFETEHPEYILAEMIHSKMCRWNHVDGCSWDYESWEKIGDSRQRYLDKATHVLSKTNLETAILVLRTI